MQCFHSGAAIDRPETTKLPPVTEVVWQQPQGLFYLIFIKTQLLYLTTVPTRLNSNGKMIRITNVANKGNLTSSIWIRYGIAPGKRN